MPLTHGLASALNTIKQPFPTELVTLIIREQEAVFRFLRGNPDCIDAPYAYKHSGSKVTLPMSVNENRVLASARACGLHNFEGYARSLFYEGWAILRSTIRDKSALCEEAIGNLCVVDLFMGIASVMNDYVSHKGRIANIYHTSILIDAFGRPIPTKAEDVLQRFLAKEHGISLGERVWSLQHQTARILEIFLADETTPAANLMNPGIAFERAIAATLREKGFTVHETAASGDFGADLVVESDGLRFVIQCKDHSRPVGVKAVQEAATARAHYLADFAVVCAQGEFTDAALELASSTKVLLCSANNLVRRLQAV